MAAPTSSQVAPGRRASRRRAALVGSALMVAAMSFPGGSARALPQAQGLRVEENQTVEQQYPPMTGQNPLPGLPEYRLITPEDCKTVTYCDVVPLEVVLPPDLTEADEFFVRVELSWETAKVPEGPTLPVPGSTGPVTNETAVNDLDLYVWDEPQDKEPVETAASADLPETLRLFRPSKGKYQIVVLNYVGPNQGYKLKVTYAPETIVPPFESLEPGFVDPGIPAPQPVAAPPVEAPEPDETPVDRSASPAPLPEVPPAPLAPPASAPAADLTPVTVEPDADFADFGDATFDEELAAPVSDVLQERRTGAVGPAAPASAGSLVFWLVILPLALLAAAGFWLARRSSSILRLS